MPRAQWPTNRWRKTLSLHRDSANDARPAWVVSYGQYVSARWPGDAYTFAGTFAKLLESDPA